MASVADSVEPGSGALIHSAAEGLTVADRLSDPFNQFVTAYQETAGMLNNERNMAVSAEMQNQAFMGRREGAAIEAQNLANAAVIGNRAQESAE